MAIFRLILLPASDGDCMLLSWGDDGPLHHMLVDGGRSGAYAMTAVDKDWYRVNVRSTEALNDVEADGFLKTSPLHRRARQGRAFVDVPRFDALTGKRTAVNWFSAWTLDELAAFDRVTIAGASAVGSLLLRDTNDAEVVDLSPVRTGNPTVLIRYPETRRRRTG